MNKNYRYHNKESKIKNRYLMVRNEFGNKNILKKLKFD